MGLKGLTRPDQRPNDQLAAKMTQKTPSSLGISLDRQTAPQMDCSPNGLFTGRQRDGLRELRLRQRAKPATGSSNGPRSRDSHGPHRGVISRSQRLLSQRQGFWQRYGSNGHGSRFKLPFQVSQVFAVKRLLGQLLQPTKVHHKMFFPRTLSGAHSLGFSNLSC